MQRLAITISLRNYLSRVTHSSSLLVVFALILLVFEIDIPGLFAAIFPHNFDMQQIPDMLFYIAGSFLFFFFIPILLNQFIYQRKLSEIGLALPQKPVEAILLSLIALVILVPCIILLSHQPQFKNYYSLHNQDFFKIVFFQMFIFPIYYFFEEFFFRGFLLNILWQKVRWHSLWITDILFVFAHIFKPLPEIVFALPAGIVFAYLALRTRSILPSMVVHLVLGVVVLSMMNQS